MHMTREEISKLSTLEKFMIINGVKPENFDKQYKVLFVVEGFSAGGNFRKMRNQKVHGIYHLKGKILNCSVRDLSSAMRSDVVKEFLNVIQEDYDQIILQTDSDFHGLGSIAPLVMTAIMRFSPSIMKDGRLLVCKSPLYIYKDKRGNMVGYGDTTENCPANATATVCKGLGSFTAKEAKQLLLYPQLGANYMQVLYDDEADESMYQAMKTGWRSRVVVSDGSK